MGDGQAKDLRRRIQKATGKVEEGWFGNLLLGSLNSALLDHYAATVGAEKSVYLAAWACRNLLELRVITVYALTSEANASSFRSELAIDAKEFYEALSKHHKSSHRKFVSLLSEMCELETSPIKEVLERALQKERSQGAITTATDSEAAAYKQVMADFALKENAKPKRFANFAESVKQKADLDPMYKVCSKIMHRTVFSVASTVTRGSLDEVIPLLSSHSDNDLIEIYGLINDHFKSRGIRPPAK